MCRVFLLFTFSSMNASIDGICILIEVIVRGGSEPVIIREELRRADGGNHQLLIPNVFPRRLLHRLRVHRVNSRK